MAQFGQTTAFLEWGGDLRFDQNGSIVMATGWDQVRQRIVRRLLTTPKFKLSSGLQVPPDYIFDVDYGVGLGRRIGEPASKKLRDHIHQAVTEAVLIDEGVDVSRPPGISFTTHPDHTVNLQITVYLIDGSAGTVSLDWEP